MLGSVGSLNGQGMAGVSREHRHTACQFHILVLAGSSMSAVHRSTSSEEGRNRGGTED